MSVEIYKVTEQAKGSFNGGEIKENKPLGFPQDGGELKAYSNIFYWANAVAKTDSEIGLHPHRGFEIMSIVLEGEIEHYDNYADAWIPLKAGDVQLIRAGRGISHAEMMRKGSRMFQIWFDPGLQRTLSKDPVYKDYKSDDFKTEENENFSVRIIKDKHGPVIMDSEAITIKDYQFAKGEHTFGLDKNTIYSFYLLSGKVELNGEAFDQDAFAVIKEEESVKIKSDEESRIILVESPAKPSYQTYFELSGW